MTVTINDIRRETASSLREAVADASGTGCLLDSEVLSILGVGSGDFEGSSDLGDVMRLVDLIDRPICTPEVGWELNTCSECGVECIDGWANYCPNCGAEVMRDEA